MSNKKLLKNCPFCGGEALLVEGVDFEGDTCHWIECKKCFTKGFEVPNEEMAIRRWNTRVPMQKIVERLEEEYKDAQMEYSEAKYHLNEMDSKDRGYISQNYRKDMNEGMCFAFDEAIEIVKEEGGLGV